MKKFIVIALTVAVAFVFAATASANDWSLYGSARMTTFYTSQDYGNQFKSAANPSGDDVFGRGSVENLQWNLQSNARIGAKVKGDMISGQFEYGTGGGNANIRRLFGVWHFTEGWGLKVGQDYTPITFFISGQVFDSDQGLHQVGMAYGSRKGQVAVEGKMGPGTFKFATITPETSSLNASSIVLAPAQTVTLPTGETIVIAGAVKSTTSTEVKFPKIEASYEFNLSDAMSMHAFAGYNTYKLYWLSPTPAGTIDNAKNINSYVVGLGADLNFGPFFVKPQASYYLNGATGGWLNSKLGLGAIPINQTPFLSATENDVVDVKSLMAMLALGFKPTESLGLEAGVGYLQSKSDSYQAEPNRSVEFKNTYMEYYLQTVITMAKGVYLVPEVGYRDYGDLEGDVEGKQDLGSLWYAGAKWQIDF
jgi:hypothetical protein